MHANLSYCDTKPKIEEGSPLLRPALGTGIYDNYKDNEHYY